VTDNSIDARFNEDERDPLRISRLTSLTDSIPTFARRDAHEARVSLHRPSTSPLSTWCDVCRPTWPISLSHRPLRSEYAAIPGLGDLAGPRYLAASQFRARPRFRSQGRAHVDAAPERPLLTGDLFRKRFNFNDLGALIRRKADDGSGQPARVATAKRQRGPHPPDARLDAPTGCVR